MKNETIIYAMLGVAIFFSMIGSCTSCNNSRSIKEAHIENMLFMYDNYMTRSELDVALEIRGLVDERRSVLNINQIFLTRKRPDERVIEIEDVLDNRYKLLEDIRKQISIDVNELNSQKER